MRFGPSAVLFVFIFLLLVTIPSCGRNPASLKAIDYIDRRTNIPIVEPIARDLAQIGRGSITVVILVAAKSTQQYSSDPVVKFGFCRGLEPVNYVRHILERFEHYQQFVVA